VEAKDILQVPQAAAFKESENPGFPN